MRIERSQSVTIWMQGGLGNQLFQLNAGFHASTSVKAPLRISRVSYLHNRLRRYEIRSMTPDVSHESLIEGLYIGSPYSDGEPATETPRGRLRIRTSIKDVEGPGDLLLGFFQDQASVAYSSTPVTSRLSMVRLSRAGSRVANIARGAVVAHVRRGDYAVTTAAKSMFGELSTRYYREALEALGASLTETVFFTDDVAHVMRDFGVPRTSVIGSADLASPLETVAVMGLAGSIVIPNSTFSWWASELVRRCGRVVAPQRWFLDRPEEFSPARSDWIRVAN
ncbi:glycosyl transferase family 11 [mine drainage metagenome]|uniref:Glycosyl transferase family 11 n=1 Tax=mine drainage metagenome TaxID=410659 RepID=A0A1J5QVB5_9ZZZZ